jgi:uncharacterized damage-inducible protein DinB
MSQGVRGLYEYHWWANRRLFDVATALGDEALDRAVGSQFSYPTLREMFAHLHRADLLWLNRWKGLPAPPPSGADVPTLTALRERRDALEMEQGAFIDALTPTDLERPVEYTSPQGKRVRLPLEPLLHHVPNHATHHRSEIATMITMISGSPPDTGRATYELTRTGQLQT